MISITPFRSVLGVLSGVDADGIDDAKGMVRSTFLEGKLARYRRMIDVISS